MSYIFTRIKKLFRFSITFKITVVYALIFTMLLLLISASILGMSGYFLRHQAQQGIRKNLEMVKTVVARDPYFYENQLVEIAEEEELIIRFVDNRNIEIFSTGDSRDLEEDTSILPPLRLKETVTVDDQILSIEIIKLLNTEEMYMMILFSTLAVVNSIAVIILLILGSKASRKMLMPIQRMTKTVKHISIHELSTRLDVGDSQDELKDLAETFNAMLDRIEASYQQQNQFVSDASHELRTPISVLQGYANLLDRWGKDDKAVLEESIGAIKSESENMKDLTEKLLFLARTDKNLQKLEKEAFAMHELIDEVVRETKLIDAKHQFIVEANEEAIVVGDRKSIKQLLRILVDNSIKFTPEGGTIKINHRKKKTLAVIEVEDTGVGIAQEDLSHIFERFYRADKSRTKAQGGQGLGLAIAKWIVDSHHGKIQVESKLGVGTKFIVRFP